MVAVGAVLFLGLSALVTDVGWMYFNHARLQTAVNAAWKAGFDRMMMTSFKNSGPLDDGDQSLIKSHIKEIFDANGFKEGDLKDISIDFGDGLQLKVYAKKEVGLFFAKILNFQTA